VPLRGTFQKLSGSLKVKALHSRAFTLRQKFSLTATNGAIFVADDQHGGKDQTKNYATCKKAK